MGLTPLVCLLAHAHGWVDAPGARKVHKTPIPRIGGVGIAVAMFLLAVPVFFLDNRIGQVFRKSTVEVTTLLVSAAFLLVVGFIDDVRGLRARVKLLAQIAAALAVCCAGVRINSLTLMDGMTIHFGPLAWPLTILWIVGITNAVNFIDGLDGLAAGVASIACAVVAVVAICSGQTVMAVLMLAMLGSLSGFLMFNFHPAKIFMGDSGALFLGFILSSASVLCSTKSGALVGLALPALALGVPIFDTLFAMLRRTLERRPMFSPDRSHIHHRLLDMGLKQRQVAIIIYGLTVLVSGMSLFMMLTRGATTLVVCLCVLLLLLLAFRMIGAVRLRESLGAIHRNMQRKSRLDEQMHVFARAHIRLGAAKSFSQWWQAVCAAGEEFGFRQVTLKAIDRDGTVRAFAWSSASAGAGRGDGSSVATPLDCPEAKSSQDGDGGSSDRTIGISVPIAGQDERANMHLHIILSPEPSLESALWRVSLLGRLLDETGPLDIPADAPAEQGDQAVLVARESSSVQAGLFTPKRSQGQYAADRTKPSDRQ